LHHKWDFIKQKKVEYYEEAVERNELAMRLTESVKVALSYLVLKRVSQVYELQREAVYLARARKESAIKI
jgi:hypothetical protein